MPIEGIFHEIIEAMGNRGEAMTLIEKLIVLSA